MARYGETQYPLLVRLVHHNVLDNPHLAECAFESGVLRLRVGAPVLLVGHQLAGSGLAIANDAVPPDRWLDRRDFGGGCLSLCPC